MRARIGFCAPLSLKTRIKYPQVCCGVAGMHIFIMMIFKCLYPTCFADDSQRFAPIQVQFLEALMKIQIKYISITATIISVLYADALQSNPTYNNEQISFLRYNCCDRIHMRLWYARRLVCKRRLVENRSNLTTALYEAQYRTERIELLEPK